MSAKRRIVGVAAGAAFAGGLCFAADVLDREAAIGSSPANRARNFTKRDYLKALGPGAVIGYKLSR